MSDNENSMNNPRSIAIAEDTVHSGQASPTAVWFDNQMPGVQDGAGDGMAVRSLDQPQARLPMPVPPFVLSTLFDRLEQAAISGEEPHPTLMQRAGVSEALERQQIAGEVTHELLSQTAEHRIERIVQMQQERQEEQEQQTQEQAQLEESLEEQRQQEVQLLRQDLPPGSVVEPPQSLPQRQQRLLGQQHEQLQQLGEREWLQRQALDRQIDEQDIDSDSIEHQPEAQRTVTHQQQRNLLRQELEAQTHHIREREQLEQQLWEHQQRLQRQREQQLQEQLQQELQVRAQQLREEQLNLQRQREQAEQRVNAAGQRERRDETQHHRERLQRSQQQRDRQRREQLQRERLELQRLVTLLAGRTRSTQPSVARNFFPAPSAHLAEQMRAARFHELSNNAAMAQVTTANNTAPNDNQSSRANMTFNRAASILQSARATLSALQDIASVVSTLTASGMDCATATQAASQTSATNRNVPPNGNGAPLDVPYYASPQSSINPPNRTGYRMPYSIAANMLPFSLSNISIASNIAPAAATHHHHHHLPAANNAGTHNYYNITNSIGENNLNAYSVGNSTSIGSSLPYLSNMAATGNNYASFCNPPPPGYNMHSCGHSNLQGSLYFPTTSNNFQSPANRTVFPVLLNRPGSTTPGYISSTGSQLPIVANVRTLTNLAANPAMSSNANYQNNTNYLFRQNITPTANYYSGVNFPHVRNPAPNVNFLPTNSNFTSDFSGSNNYHTESNYSQRLPNPLGNTTFTYLNPAHVAWFSANAVNNMHSSAYMEPILKAICTWQYHARIAQQNLMVGNQALEDLYQQPQYAHIYQNYYGVPFSPSTTSNSNNTTTNTNVNNSNRNASMSSTNTSSTTVTGTTVRNQSSFNAQNRTSASALRDEETSMSDAHSGILSNVGSLYHHSQSPNNIDSEEDEDVVEYMYDNMDEPSPA